MSEKIAVLRIKRNNKDFLYYVNDNAVWQICRKLMGAPKAGPEQIANFDGEMDIANFAYYLDRDGDVSRTKRKKSLAVKFSECLAGHNELLDTDSNLDKLRWLRYQMLDVMDFTEQTDDGNFVATELFTRLDEYIRGRENRICKMPGCRWNTKRVCDNFCRKCRDLLKVKEKTCKQR